MTKRYEVIEEQRSPTPHEAANMSIPQIAMEWSNFGNDLERPRKRVVEIVKRRG